MVRFELNREDVKYLYEVVYFVSCCLTKWDDTKAYYFDFIGNQPREFKDTVEMLCGKRYEHIEDVNVYFDISTKNFNEIIYSLKYAIKHLNSYNKIVEPYTFMYKTYVKNEAKLNELLFELSGLTEYKTDKQYIADLDKYAMESELAWLRSSCTISCGWD